MYIEVLFAALTQQMLFRTILNSRPASFPMPSYAHDLAFGVSVIFVQEFGNDVRLAQDAVFLAETAEWHFRRLTRL